MPFRRDSAVSRFPGRRKVQTLSASRLSRDWLTQSPFINLAQASAARDQTSQASEDARHGLDSQPFWNQNAIEQIEKPLYQQRQHSCWNRALQNCCVIVQIKAA